MHIYKGTRALTLILSGSLLSLSLLFSGCASILPEDSKPDSIYQEPTTWADFAEFPAVFTGTLPCASCPGIDYQLLLHSNQSYLLRRYYQERTPGTFDSIGRWQLDGQTLTLTEADDSQLFRLLEQGDLELLDSAGQTINSSLNYQLMRLENSPADNFALPLQGQFTYMADAALFVECSTGLQFPVAMQEAYLNAERAYLGARLAPAEPVLMQLVARIESLPDMEETRLQPTLVIQQLITLWPGQPCPE